MRRSILDTNSQVHTVKVYDSWHGCLGHPFGQVLSLLAKNLDVNDSVSNKLDEPCDVAFMLNKLVLHLLKVIVKFVNFLELLHFHIWGTYYVPSTP